MTNEQILAFAASMNYAPLYIDSSCCIRFGRQKWEHMLPELTREQRDALVAKIERQQARAAREVQACQ